MVCLTIWLKNIQDPIYHDCQDQQCAGGEKVIKKFVPSFQCPIPEGCTTFVLLIALAILNISISIIVIIIINSSYTLFKVIA